ncbi:hypothetical protein COP2_004469 [Malus domestica]
MFQGAVKDFSLAICLWVVCRTSAKFAALKMKELLPKVAHEDGVTIRNDRLGHAMEFENFLNKNVGYQSCCVRVLKWNEVAVL